MGKCGGGDDGLLQVLSSMAFVFVLSCCSPFDSVREKWRAPRARRTVSKVVNLSEKKKMGLYLSQTNQPNTKR
jgi:hypothetical protein